MGRPSLCNVDHFDCVCDFHYWEPILEREFCEKDEGWPLPANMGGAW